MEKYRAIILWNMDRKYICDETKWYLRIKEGRTA